MLIDIVNELFTLINYFKLKGKRIYEPISIYSITLMELAKVLICVADPHNLTFFFQNAQHLKLLTQNTAFVK